MTKFIDSLVLMQEVLKLRKFLSSLDLTPLEEVVLMRLAIEANEGYAHMKTQKSFKNKKE